MNMPGFHAEASLYGMSEQYGYAVLSSARTMFDSVLAQQLCRHLGQTCGGIDLFCCPGLRCTAGLGGHGVDMASVCRKCSIAPDARRRAGKSVVHPLVLVCAVLFRDVLCLCNTLVWSNFRRPALLRSDSL
jgi:hypothetical protein